MKINILFSRKEYVGDSMFNGHWKWRWIYFSLEKNMWVIQCLMDTENEDKYTFHGERNCPWLRFW